MKIFAGENKGPHNKDMKDKGKLTDSWVSDRDTTNKEKTKRIVN